MLEPASIGRNILARHGVEGQNKALLVLENVAVERIRACLNEPGLRWALLADIR
jgi:hypothetical protein